MKVLILLCLFISICSFAQSDIDEVFICDNINEDRTVEERFYFDFRKDHDKRQVTFKRAETIEGLEEVDEEFLTGCGGFNSDGDQQQRAKLFSLGEGSIVANCYVIDLKTGKSLFNGEPFPKSSFRYPSDTGIFSGHINLNSLAKKVNEFEDFQINLSCRVK